MRCPRGGWVCFSWSCIYAEHLLHVLGESRVPYPAFLLLTRSPREDDVHVTETERKSRLTAVRTPFSAGLAGARVGARGWQAVCGRGVLTTRDTFTPRLLGRPRGLAPRGAASASFLARKCSRRPANYRVRTCPPSLPRSSVSRTRPSFKSDPRAVCAPPSVCPSPSSEAGSQLRRRDVALSFRVPCCGRPGWVTRALPRAS